jgi:hypothetical protein
VTGRALVSAICAGTLLLAACSAQADAGAVACGEFDVGAEWQQAQRDPVHTGVRCLINAFDDGRPATLTFAYEGQQTRLVWEYEVDGPDSIDVTSHRSGRHVDPRLRLVRERCAALEIDSDGAPVALRCTQLDEGS